MSMEIRILELNYTIDYLDNIEPVHISEDSRGRVTLTYTRSQMDELETRLAIRISQNCGGNVDTGLKFAKSFYKLQQNQRLIRVVGG